MRLRHHCFSIVMTAAGALLASACSQDTAPTKRSKKASAPPQQVEADPKTDADPNLGLPPRTDVPDPALVEAGRGAFQSRCTPCHATPDSAVSGSPPTEQWSMHLVGTDAPMLRNLAFRTKFGRTQQYGSLEAATRDMLPPDSPQDLVDGLVAYQQSLLCGASDFDRDTLGDAASRGWDLFRGKASCAMCHNGPLFTDGALHVVAAGADGATTRYETPSLRGVSRSAPYFHDGSASSLADAVARMVEGGAPDVDGKDPIFRPVDLSSTERADVVAFLQALDCR